MVKNSILTVPQLGVNDDRAKVVNWSVNEGDKCSKDQVVCELETTKALQEVINPFMSKIYDQQAPGAPDWFPMGTPEEGGFPEPGADASSTAASVEEVD